MKKLIRYMLVLVSSLAFVGALVPAFASAQVYPSYYTNCNTGYTYYPYTNNCNTGTLLVYVQVNNQNSYQNSYYLSPADFTVYVSGTTASQQYFPGSQNGTSVNLTGSYGVSIQNLMGYTPSYSTGCSGAMTQGQSQTCVISLTPSYSYTNNYYPYNYSPYTNQYPYQYQQPVSVVSKYVPTLPNTGFEPISSTSLAFSLALILVLGVLLYPYVRKTFTAVLS